MENVETQLEDVEAIIIECYNSEMRALHPQDSEDCINKLEHLLRIDCALRDNSTQTESEFAVKGVATMLEYAGEEHVNAVKKYLAIGTKANGMNALVDGINSAAREEARAEEEEGDDGHSHENGGPGLPSVRPDHRPDRQ